VNKYVTTSSEDFELFILCMKRVEINDDLAKAAYLKLLSTKKTTLCNKIPYM
jgi:hypothetical protein